MQVSFWADSTISDSCVDNSNLIHSDFDRISLSFFNNKKVQQLELHSRSFLIYVVPNHKMQLESTKRHTLSLYYNILPFQYAYSYVLFLVSCL